MPDPITSDETSELEELATHSTANPRPPFSLTKILFAVLLLITLFTRFYDLGSKPPHHDESMHAFYSMQLQKELDYQYNPMMHGPFQFHGNALMFFFFGPSTAASRYLAAFFGVTLVALALMMGPFIGRTASLFSAALIAFSPGFMYFSRFCREDIYAVTGILALVVFLFRYVRYRKVLDLCLASAGFATAYCSKETAFLAVGILGSYFFFRFSLFLIERQLSKQTPPDGFDNLMESLPWRKAMLEMLAAAGIFITIFILLFTTFFTIALHQPTVGERITALLRGLYNGVFGALEYWWSQHNIRRGNFPFYYYSLQMLANEAVILFPALAAAIYYVFRKRKDMPLFLAYWFFVSLLAFTVAGEKMPWLIIHILLPAVLLAGYFLGDTWESRPQIQARKILRFSVLLAFGILTAYSLFSATRLCFKNAANPAEPYVYVQSSPDCLEVEKIVRKISQGETGGTGLALTIHDCCSWPFAWLLWDFQKRNHPSTISSADNPVIFSAVESDDKIVPMLSKAGYVDRRYKLRVWWLYTWFKKGYPKYRVNTYAFLRWFFGNFIPIAKPQTDMVDWDDLWKWIAHRQVWSEEGSYDMRLWVRSDLAQKYGFTGDASPAAPVSILQH